MEHIEQTVDATVYNISVTHASRSFWATSASWASASLNSTTSSYTHKSQNSVFASQSRWATSASWASSSVSSSYSEISNYTIFSELANSSSYSVSSSYSRETTIADGFVKFGKKLISLTTSSYTNVLDVNMNDHDSVWVKITIHGNWEGHGAIGYNGEYLLQTDSSSPTKTPGAILKQENNNFNGHKILSKIPDPIDVHPRNLNIEMILEGNNDMSSVNMIYEVRGLFNSIT